MTVENHLMRAYRESKRKPPPRVYAPAVVPGYGQYIHEKARKKLGQIDASHDRTQPRSVRVRPAQRAPYDPTGDYKHPRRPRGRARWD